MGYLYLFLRFCSNSTILLLCYYALVCKENVLATFVMLLMQNINCDVVIG